MTEANRLATLFVLEHARYSPPYAVFQFGHEIRVARLHLFYLVLRWLGADIEYKVNADGTFQFDQFIYWLEKRFNHGQVPPEQRPLYCDEEVIAEVLGKCPEILTVFALKHAHVPPIMNIGTEFSGKAAPLLGLSGVSIWNVVNKSLATW